VIINLKRVGHLWGAYPLYARHGCRYYGYNRKPRSSCESSTQFIGGMAGYEKIHKVLHGDKWFGEIRGV
jgi:hypothetical protein